MSDIPVVIHILIVALAASAVAMWRALTQKNRRLQDDIKGLKDVVEKVSRQSDDRAKAAAVRVKDESKAEMEKLAKKIEKSRAEVKALEDAAEDALYMAKTHWRTRAVNLERQITYLSTKEYDRMVGKYNAAVDAGEYKGNNTPAHKVNIGDCG